MLVLPRNCPTRNVAVSAAAPPTTTRMVARTTRAVAESRAGHPQRSQSHQYRHKRHRHPEARWRQQNREQRNEGANGERERRHPDGVPGAHYIVLGYVQLEGQVSPSAHRVG